MNIIEIAIIAVIAVAVFFALRHTIKMQKSGCSCCCAECNRACGTAHRKG